jgi:hypothetical protein
MVRRPIVLCVEASSMSPTNPAGRARSESAPSAREERELVLDRMPEQGASPTPHCRGGSRGGRAPATRTSMRHGLVFESPAAGAIGGEVRSNPMRRLVAPVLKECHYCGAPLNVAGSLFRVKCSYCGTVTDIRQLRPAAEQVPPDWRPPPVWIPPRHVPADSSTTLHYHRHIPPTVAVAVAVIVLGFVGPAIATQCTRWSSSSATIEREKRRLDIRPAFPEQRRGRQQSSRR